MNLNEHVKSQPLKYQWGGNVVPPDRAVQMHQIKKMPGTTALTLSDTSDGGAVILRINKGH